MRENVDLKFILKEERKREREREREREKRIDAHRGAGGHLMYPL